MYVMDIGTAELRNRLSYFLRKVRNGASLVVTDHGRPVARLVPIRSKSDLSSRIAEMVASGAVTAESERTRADARPVILHRPGVLASQLVSAMRDER
jgi:prevent-host-death family protein